MSNKLPSHADRVVARQAVNGQPNGYAPISEAQLQAGKAIQGFSSIGDYVDNLKKAA